MKFYPSKNRFDLLSTIQEEVHENRGLSEGEAIRKERLKAEMGLRHVFYYMHKNREMVSTKKFTNEEEIEPFAKKREDNLYF